MAYKKRARGGGDSSGINMTPMIDIVFQMIIFFVLTVQMERQALDEEIRLAMSPHGPAVEERDPREITVDVNRRGNISIGRVAFSEGMLYNVMRKAVAEYGQTTPVVIRGDMDTRHDDIRRVMDICTRAGLWKVKFAAVKDTAQ